MLRMRCAEAVLPRAAAINPLARRDRAAARTAAIRRCRGRRGCRSAEITAIFALPELGIILERDGTAALAISPAAFGARVTDELAQWKQIAADHKIVAE